MDTAEIVDALREQGLTIAESDLDATGSTDLSAWEVGEVWVERADATGDDAEFIRLAACELWRRWRPHLPSAEMLDELMQSGYLAQEHGDEQGAYERWMALGDWLVDLTPVDIRTIEDIATWFPGQNSVSNWLGDAVITFHNASLKRVELRDAARRLYTRLAERFEPSRHQRAIRAEMGSLSFATGDDAIGEGMFRQLIAESRAEAAPYSRLAYELSDQGRTREALDVVEVALAYPVSDGDAWGLPALAAALRSRL